MILHATQYDLPRFHWIIWAVHFIDVHLKIRSHINIRLNKVYLSQENWTIKLWPFVFSLSNFFFSLSNSTFSTWTIKISRPMCFYDLGDLGWDWICNELGFRSHNHFVHNIYLTKAISKSIETLNMNFSPSIQMYMQSNIYQETPYLTNITGILHAILLSLGK